MLSRSFFFLFFIAERPLSTMHFSYIHDVLLDINKKPNIYIRDKGIQRLDICMKDVVIFHKRYNFWSFEITPVRF